MFESVDGYRPFTGNWTFCAMRSDDGFSESRAFVATCYCGANVCLGWALPLFLLSSCTFMMLSTTCVRCYTTFSLTYGGDGEVKDVLCYAR